MDKGQVRCKSVNVTFLHDLALAAQEAMEADAAKALEICSGK